jgi:hypothetical protein
VISCRELVGAQMPLKSMMRGKSGNADVVKRLLLLCCIVSGFGTKTEEAWDMNTHHVRKYK